MYLGRKNISEESNKSKNELHQLNQVSYKRSVTTLIKKAYYMFLNIFVDN